MRDCILGLCDEVCIYHRENDIYDRVLKVGLRILKVQPVESKQPRLHYVSHNVGAIVEYLFLSSHGPLDSTFGLARADIGPAVIFFLSLANRKLKLHKLLLSIQPNWD